MAGLALPDLDSTVLVGLGHKARHGKDTVAGMILTIARSLGYSAERFSFASALYDHCRSQHGMTVKDAPLLQRVGVEAREQDPAVWVRTALWKIHDAAPKLAVITDVRFENEANVIRERAGLVLKVSRYDEGGRPWQDPSRPATHISETALDDYYFDETLLNSGSLDDLKVKVLGIMPRIIGRIA